MCCECQKQMNSILVKLTLKSLFCRLSGLSPFMGDSDVETFSNITRADYDYDDEAFDCVYVAPHI